MAESLDVGAAPATQSHKKWGVRRFLLWFAVAVVVVLSLLRPLGFLRPFKVPTGAMTPTLSRGDHFMMEGFTFRARAPRRGDVVVFKTDGISRLRDGMIYIKRVAGLPGDTLRISDGNLYANDTHVRLENAAGDIRYVFLPGSIHLTSRADTVVVPKGHYFVLGDDSLRSSDSRFYGFVPAENILGRASFRYWPPSRIGWVR